jgi:nicotinate-nucleotide--dimethylbenzimidazole phosphoribosyltransferase
VACITGAEVEKVTGRGTGIGDEAWQNKVGTIKKALEINSPDSKDAIDILSKVGGFEIGGLVGVILAGAAHKVPVVIDGFISGAAALIATGLEPKVKDHLIAAHCSVEIGHRITLEKMGLKPLLDLNLRLGEGTGAALGMGIVEAGCKILNEMATFESAGVSEASK